MKFSGKRLSGSLPCLGFPFPFYMCVILLSISAWTSTILSCCSLISSLSFPFQVAFLHLLSFLPPLAAVFTISDIRCSNRPCDH